MIRFSCLVFLCIIFQFGLNAQIPAPALNCVTTIFNGDNELQFQAPNVSCGPLNGYVVYASQNQTGPFIAIDTIFDLSQSSYIHVNANGGNNVWYYYMESDASCMGQTPMQSNLLDNLDPLVSCFNFLNVNGATVEMDWTVSTSLETVAYILFQYTSNGPVPIDTIYGRNNTNFTHIETFPTLQSEKYTIASMDSCGNVGLISFEPHQTIFLERIDAEVCDRSFNLGWNPYVNWKNGIEKQELWLSLNGEPANLIAALSPQDSSYVYEDVERGAFYCFTVKAKENNSPNESVSNDLCFTANVIQPMRNLYLENVSVTDSNTIEVDWLWDQNADLINYSLLHSEENSDFLNIFTVPPPSNMLPFNDYEHLNGSPDEAQEFFSIETIDSCNEAVVSNVLGTIFLSGTPEEDFINLVEWTPYEHDYGEVLNYELYRSVNGNASFVTSLSSFDTYYRHQVDGYNEAEVNTCYYVVATVKLDWPDGSSNTVKSQSNTGCVEQFALIWMPNAFIPSGINYEFKPRIVYGQFSDYRMQIFNRWGGKVFETSDLDEGWNGQKDNKDLPAGVYGYLVIARQNNGNLIEKKGSLVLIR